MIALPSSLPKPACGHFEEMCRHLKRRANICKDLRAFEKINRDADVTRRDGSQWRRRPDTACR